MNSQRSQYMTPSWAARELWDAHFSDVTASDSVAELCCGDGRMLDAIPPQVPAFGVEIDHWLADEARERTQREVITGDALKVDFPHAFNIVFSNPPWKASFMDDLLRRLEPMQQGLRMGLILPAYFMQTPNRVVRWNKTWALYTELLPRTLWPRLSRPVIFALFTRDNQRIMSGMRLMLEAQGIENLKPIFREMMTTGRGVWFVVLDTALRSLGGEAHLTLIYEAIAVKRPTDNPWWKEKIRQTLQRKFQSDVRGIWRLKAA